MSKSSTDRIEKQIEINVPIQRVWKALTDYREFGERFRVKLEQPFVVGKASSGRITYPGYEHVTMRIIIHRMDAPHHFAYRWHPYAVDPAVDYSVETPTLVEFELTPTAKGTLLRVTESGFDSIPIGRRDEAFRMNNGGWEEQLRNIQTYAHATP